MAAPAPQPGTIRLFKVSCHLVTLLVILQAVLAGMFISGEQSDAMDQHKIMGYIVVLAVVGQLAVAYLVRGWGQFRLMYWVGLLLVLSVVQVGLGSASEDHSFPEAVHIPLGVFMFGLALVISVLAVTEDRAGGSAA